MQETFLKAYRGYGRFRGDSEEKTWLTRIAINVCKDISKSAWMRRVNRGISLEDVPEPAVPPVEADDTLIKAVMALPPKLREAVLLFYYLSLPAGEVAKALHIALPTVYKRLDKAVAAQDWPAGGAALASIRTWVSVNLAIGVAIIAITLLMA